MGAAAVGSMAVRRRWAEFPERGRVAAGLALVAAVYVANIVRLSTAELVGDESGYLGFAANLTHGYYSPPGEVHLWWGPGYPALLAPFLALHAPLLALRLLDALLIVGALASAYATARRYLDEPRAMLVTAFLAVYVAFMQPMQLLLSEPLAMFLASVWMYLVCCRRSRAATMGAAIALTWLALTKVLFGWVILVALCAAIVLKHRRFVASTGLALVLCTPYLVYTYALSGNVFYWGTSGGLSLYWMSTPYADERGDWFPVQAMRDDPRLAPHHASVYDAIAVQDEVQQNAALSKLAVQQIADDPIKYAHNWLDNVGRMLINYPYSFTPFRATSIGVGALNAVLVALVGAALLRRRGHVPLELVSVLVVAAIAFGGSTLLSAYPRQMVPLAPWLLVAPAAIAWRSGSL